MYFFADRFFTYTPVDRHWYKTGDVSWLMMTDNMHHPGIGLNRPTFVNSKDQKRSNPTQLTSSVFKRSLMREMPQSLTPLN